jgi:hypothetical protein
MPRWDGGVDASGARHQSTWARVASFALARQLDPIELVRSAFAVCDRVEPPRPNQLTSDRAVTWCRAAARQRCVQRRTMARAFLERLLSGLAAACRGRDGLDWEHAVWRVLAPHTASEPLLCFCVAVRYGHRDLIASLWQPALAVYLSAVHEWEQALGELIPEDLRQYVSDCVPGQLDGGKETS